LREILSGRFGNPDETRLHCTYSPDHAVDERERPSLMGHPGRETARIYFSP
jgi:hypothetical protein